MSYLSNNEFTQSESTILEAIRLEPDSVSYRLMYLHIVQQSGKPPSSFMAELQHAYDDLPDSPEIILALARGFDKIDKNKRDARHMYSEFLQKAPLAHPEREAVEKAIEELR